MPRILFFTVRTKNTHQNFTHAVIYSRRILSDLSLLSAYKKVSRGTPSSIRNDRARSWEKC